MPHFAIRAAIAALLLVFAALPARAEPPKTDELQRLVSTLENDADRARLVEQLNGLIAAQRKAAKAEEAGLLGNLSERVEVLGGELLQGVATVKEAPRLVGWLGDNLGDAVRRNVWGAVLWQLAAVLAAGILADRLVGRLLRRPIAKLDPHQPVTSLVRLPLGLARAAIRLAPVAAFAGAAGGTLTLLGLGGNARVAALMVVTAYASVRAVMVAVRLVAAPRSPHLRLLPVDDETAEYLEIWTRRLVGVGVFGTLGTQAAALLGLPKGGQVLLLKGVGLAVATMLAIFILQNRTGVAAWLRGRGLQWGGRVRNLQSRLADIWHVLAVLYVAAGYLVWALGVKGGFEFMLRATVLSVVILLVAAGLSAGLKRLIDRGFAVGAETKSRFPRLEARANRYLPLLHGMLRGAVALVAALALAQSWGIDVLGLLGSPGGRRVIASAVSIVAVLLGALLAWELVSGSIERYLAATDGDGNAVERSARARTLLPLARNALFVVLVVMVALIVLAELGVNIAPLLAGAGVVGIAVGFGAQTLVKDVITGAFILFEDTIAVGDLIKLDAHTGTVEAMSIRAIRLRDGTGALHTVPFSAVTTVVNMSRDFAFAVFEIGVSYEADTDHVARVMEEVGADLRADPDFAPDIVEPLEVWGLERFDASAVVIKARFRTRPMRQWRITREYNRRLKKRFDAEGIEIPFPQSTVWMGDRKAAAVPVPAPVAASA